MPVILWALVWALAGAPVVRIDGWLVGLVVALALTLVLRVRTVRALARLHREVQQRE